MSSEMLYQILRSQIEHEKLTVGSEMPTEADLCAEYHLSRGTVRVALLRLAEDGYLRAGQGRKRVVQRRQPLKLERLKISSKNYAELSTSAGRSEAARRSPSFGEYLRSLGLRPADVVLRTAMSVPCFALAEEPRFGSQSQVSDQLQITPENEVHWVLRLRLGDDEPVALQWAVVVASLVPEISLDFLIPGGLTQLYERHGVRRQRMYAAYSPTRASKSEAIYLRIGTGAPLIEERRVSYCRTQAGPEIPYEYLVSLYTERIALTFEWDDAPPLPRTNRRIGSQTKRVRREPNRP